MRHDPSIRMGTLCHAITDARDGKDPNVVKVVVNAQGNALYFSRSPIPYVREKQGGGKSPALLRHIGIYAYRRDFLLQYVRWRQSPLEHAEKLEQLRALEHGVAIRVLKTTYHAIGVDAPSDMRKVEKLLRW